ncbi:MAG: trypsin-like peptidase domain-containing protein [Bacteroidales bacterium]|nr:trypsin-like peptidase domain-containing protein [Bacteroidales bacterium]
MSKVAYILLIVISLSLAACRHDRRPSARRDYARTETTQSQQQPRQTDTKPTNTQKTSGTILSGSEIYKKCNSAVFYVLTTDGTNGYQGSGFFVTPNGRAVSNYHVFKGTLMGGEEIHLTDGRKLKIANVVAKSQKYDFIVFDVKTSKSVNYIPLSTHKPQVGEKVYAIGSPLGLDNTFSSGEISQIRPNEDYQLQISVPIDHGSSGGALINQYGEVIGITSAGLGEISSANLNFAVDIERVRTYLK